MKKIFALLLIAIFTATVCIGCSNGVSVEKESEITDFPYVTDDGHVLYKLTIDDKEVKTKNYPFRYTAEALLEQKQKEYDKKSDKESTTLQTTEGSSNSKTTSTTKTTTKTTTTKTTTSSTKTTVATTAKYIDLIEADEYCTYYPIKDVLEFYDIKYVESDEHDTITTEINKRVLYIRADKSTMYFGDEIAKLTPPVVYNDCLYATASFFKYFLGLDSGLSFDKTTASLNKPAEAETTTSAAETCSKCKGTGMIKCPECGGDGIDSQYEILYNEDTNAQWTNPAPNERKCTHCDGKGYITCPDCDGYGVTPTAKYTLDKLNSVETTAANSETTTTSKK